MASVVGKTIFSDGKGKLFFGYYKDNDAVEFVDYKTWKKLSFKDVSKGDTNKERVIKAIVKNQKQFNKKVDFNMWAKQKKRTFEETMDWFIQNGWISNVTKRGIKESVDILSVNEGQLNVGDTIKIQSGTSLQKMNVTGDKWKVIKKDNSTYTLQKLGSSMKVRHPQTKVDYLIVRPGQSQLPFIVESVNEDKGEVEKIKKQVGKNEIKFYDALSKVEKRLGSKYPKFLDTALKQLKQNPSKFKTNADKEEAIFQSVK